MHEQAGLRSKADTAGVPLIFGIVQTLLQRQSAGPRPVLRGVVVLVDAGRLFFLYYLWSINVLHETHPTRRRASFTWSCSGWIALADLYLVSQLESEEAGCGRCDGEWEEGGM